MSNNDILADRLKSVLGNGVTVQDSQKAYGSWAPSYEQELLKEGYSPFVEVAKRICDKFPEGTRDQIRILDVGAGTGLVAKELRKYGFKHLHALEPQEGMRNEAKRYNLYEKYYTDFISEKPLDIPADTYDALSGSGIYGAEGHVPCEALFEMIRLVKPGGYIVLATRSSVIITSKNYIHLEPLMDKLEANGQWKKVSRELFPRIYKDYEGIVWCYQVL